MEDTYSNFSGRTTAAAPAEDYRLYDRIWQRVAPELNPYPEVRQAESAGGTESAALGDTGENLEHLPGAQSDPCCMGSAAMDSLQVLTGFLEDERAGRRTLLQLAAQAANPRTVRVLRQLAAERHERLRQLTAAYYLTTGSRYVPTVQVQTPAEEDFCAALRSVYHETACIGLNYLRAADGTADLCLEHMFQRMGKAAFQQADQLLRLVSLFVR